jgi:hypothetical protein
VVGPGAATSATYDCRVEDNVHWDAPKLKSYPLSSIGETVRFDDVSGEMRLGKTVVFEMQIVQRHSSGGVDLVAERSSPISRGRAYHQILRFRGWAKDHPISFMYFDGWAIYSGPCELLP